MCSLYTKCCYSYTNLFFFILTFITMKVVVNALSGVSVEEFYDADLDFKMTSSIFNTQAIVTANNTSSSH